MKWTFFFFYLSLLGMCFDGMQIMGVYCFYVCVLGAKVLTTVDKNTF